MSMDSVNWATLVAVVVIVVAITLCLFCRDIVSLLSRLSNQRGSAPPAIQLRRRRRPDFPSPPPSIHRPRPSGASRLLLSHHRVLPPLLVIHPCGRQDLAIAPRDKTWQEFVEFSSNFRRITTTVDFSSNLDNSFFLRSLQSPLPPRPFIPFYHVPFVLEPRQGR